jgi:hypothetical protein
MKNLIIAASIFAAAAGAVAPASAQVTVNIGQPGFYGRIDIGGYAPPPVYYTQPVIVERQVRYVGQPMYLRVPEGHRKHWNKHCRAYNACGQQVSFVQDGWYNNTYAPRYRQQHYREQPRPVMVRDGYRDDRRDGYREDRRDDRRDDDHGKHDKHDKHGNGNGHGNGHGKGHDKHGD